MRKKALWTVLALTLVLAAAVSLASRWSRPAPAPEATAQPTEAQGKVLALFGTSSDPWCQTVQDGAEVWAAQAGWRVIRYDCRGYPASRERQLDDLLSREEADLAVLLDLGDRGVLADQVRRLREGGIPAVTVSREPGPPTAGQAVCHIGASYQELLEAAGDYLAPLTAEPGEGVILLPDILDDPRETAALTAFDQRGVDILELAHSWGGVDIARTYLLDAMARFPKARAVVCFSRTGVLGVSEAVAAQRRTGEFQVLSLVCSREILEDVAQARVDAALAVSAQEAAEALAEALTRVSQGERPGRVPLTLVPAQAGMTGDLGYGLIP